MKAIKIIILALFVHLQLSAQLEKLHHSTENHQLNDVTVLGNKIDKHRNFIYPYENIKLVKVNGGTFIMGDINPRPDTPYYSDQPKHKVTLDDFYIATTEVTQELWKSIMKNNPSSLKGDELPVYFVSWNDAQSFISKLNQLTGKKYRLPTEAEWEYAAGGAVMNGSKFSGTNDDSELKDYAWVFENSDGKVHPVATKKPNSLGLYDMTGNVWEWCSDYLGPYPSTSQTNPKGGSEGYRRVSRGGSWLNKIVSQNLTLRGGYAPESSNSRYGFRLAMDAK